MTNKLSLIKISNRLLSALFKQKVVTNYRRQCAHCHQHALIYYKTDGFTPGYIFNLHHTNTWEVVCMANILNRLGYSVDIIDRSISASYLPSNKYELFISDGSVDSTKHYTKYAQQLPSAIKIYFAVNPNPKTRNLAVQERYDNFFLRHNKKISPHRFISQIDLQQQMSLTDYIFSVGNQVTNDTYNEFNLPLKKIYLSTSPHLNFDIQAVQHKQAHNFLFFGGDGNIFKGLDLILEAFAATPDINLYVCTPIEPDFLQHYKSLLRHSPNISLLGFVPVNSRLFTQLTNQCAFVTLLGCAEGTATSVLTCMRRGLIPVVTPETGLDIESFGFNVSNLSIPALSGQYLHLSQLSRLELERRIYSSYLASFKYTQQSFEQSFTSALLSVLQERHKL